MLILLAQEYMAVLGKFDDLGSEMLFLGEIVNPQVDLLVDAY